MTNIDSTKRRILFEMFRFTKELSESKIPQLYELGHYLTDNLISKISMLVGQESGIEFEYTTKSGKIRTRDFKWLYEEILHKVYPLVPDFSRVERLHDQRNTYQHDSFAIDHHFNQQYALDYVVLAEKILLNSGIIEGNVKITTTNFIGKEKIGLEESKNSEMNDKKILIRFYQMISHSIEFTKGELISLVREIGKHNMNKYLDLEFGDSEDMIFLRNEIYHVIIYGPGIPGFGNFEVHKLNTKENNQYKDKPDNFGNVKIYTEFLNYLKQKVSLI